MAEIPAAELVGYIVLGLGLLGAFGDVSAQILSLDKWKIGTWFNIVIGAWYLLLLLVWAVLFGRITLV